MTSTCDTVYWDTHSRRRKCFTLCTSTCAAEALFCCCSCHVVRGTIPAIETQTFKCTARRYCRNLQVKNTKQRHLGLFLFVCELDFFFLSRWSAVTYSDKTIRAVCFWLSQCFFWVAKEMRLHPHLRPRCFRWVKSLSTAKEGRHTHLIITCSQLDKQIKKKNQTHDITCVGGDNTKTMCECWHWGQTHCLNLAEGNGLWVLRSGTCSLYVSIHERSLSSPQNKY